MKPAHVRDRILEALGPEPKTVAELAAAAGCSIDTGRAILGRLAQTGAAVKSGPPDGFQPPGRPGRPPAFWRRA